MPVVPHSVGAMAERQTERFQWGWILGSALLGLTLLVFAHVSDLVWRWPSVTTGVISSVGAAFLLAFVLFLFERRFTRGVVERVKDVAEAVVSARTEALGTRLEDLEARLDSQRAETEATQDATIEAIAYNVSFDTISAALAEAEQAGAIRRGSLTVPGSRTNPRLAVKFQFATKEITRGDGLVLDDGTIPKLSVQVMFAKRAGEWWSPVIDVDWEPTMTSVEIATALRAQLRQRDRLAEAKAFDFALAVGNLQAALRLAHENQRVPAGQEAIRGILYEVATDEWVVTSAGVENTRTGLVLSRQALGFDARNDEQPSPPAAPAGIDEAAWAYVLLRAGSQPKQDVFGLFG